MIWLVSVGGVFLRPLFERVVGKGKRGGVWGQFFFHIFLVKKERKHLAGKCERCIFAVRF